MSVREPPRRPEPETPYAQWVRDVAPAAVDASGPTDLDTLELKPWPQRGGFGAFVLPAALPVAGDCSVCEIPPAASLLPQRHPFEEIVLVLAGRGSTALRDDRGVMSSFEWTAWTLFAIPRNTPCRHFNGSGKQSARLVSVTTAPGVLNGRNDPTPAAAATSDVDHACLLAALDCPLLAIPEHGAGGHLRSRLGTRGLSVFISQLPPATCGKAQVCGPDTYTIVLEGRGYSLVWPKDGQRIRWDWRQGTLLSVPNAWSCQHFNPETSPARLVTLAPESSA